MNYWECAMINALFSLLKPPPCPKGSLGELKELLAELHHIGRTDDFLSERPGLPFDSKCRHARARQIGARLDDLGGIELMEYVYQKMCRRLGKTLAAHLEYCWAGIGSWLP
jgi:hypothetical protein